MADPLFKGYVPTRDKGCLVKFKDHPENLKSIGEVGDLPEYAGILSESTVLIDIDNQAQSETLMGIVEDEQLNCRVYETTRGKHFLFLNDGHFTRCTNGATLACGIQADIKVGSKNSYSVLKFDGKVRPIIWDIDDGEAYQPAPSWLRPVKGAPIFAEMHEGDGRNEALFAHILALGRAGLTKEQTRECIGIIGSCVLPEPMGGDEVSKIMRDEAFPDKVFNPHMRFMANGKFNHFKFAEYMVETCPMRSINGVPHMYKGGIYTCSVEEIERAMLRIEPTLASVHRSEAMKTIRLIVDAQKSEDETALVAFANGLYDLDTGNLLPFSPDRVVTNMIPWDYNPQACSDVLDKTLEKLACGDQSIRSLLEEAVGYCFYRRNELRKSFILVGDRSNGKSTYLSMVRNLLGAGNTAALDLKDIGSRFRTAELLNKLANVGDDISDEFMRGELVAQFKKAVTGEMLTAEHKGEKPFRFAPYAKLLFSANTIPRIKDDTGAVLSRLAIIPFDASFSASDADYDPEISDKLQGRESMEALVVLGLLALERVLARKGFTRSAKVERQVEDYHRTNNPVIGFFEGVSADELVNNPTGDAYKMYLEYCHAGGFNPMANNPFTTMAKKHYGFDVAIKKLKLGRDQKSKTYRVFVEGEKRGGSGGA